MTLKAAPRGIEAAASERARDSTAADRGAQGDDASARAPGAAGAEQPAALDAILGANPFVAPSLRYVVSLLGAVGQRFLARPGELASRLGRLGIELGEIAAGVSSLEPAPEDRRFADAAFTGNPFYRRLMQTYLAWRTAVYDLVKADGSAAAGDWKTAEQLQFAAKLLAEALAPTNVLIGNPAALKRAFDTAGLSLARGLRNFVGDLLENGGMPAQVDKRPFVVGKTLAVSRGAVVRRSPLFELIQYQPLTEKVLGRPLVIIPPQINKFYIMDLAPGRSFVEYAVGRGIQVFVMSWKNPGRAQSECGLDEYVDACKEATAAACAITGNSQCNVLGICAGGITTAILLGHLAALGDERVNAATLLVAMLDTKLPSMTGMFATKELVASAVERSRRQGVLSAAEMGRLFAWLRPNDLVWNYWVNNYLMGERPAAFDILYWNNDSTNLPARLHAGFMRLFTDNPLQRAGAWRVLGTPIDLREVKCDLYVAGGQTDHICAWRAAYHGARMFGGKVEFVLNSSGHVQTLVCPPGNPKARYFTNARLPDDPDAWLHEAAAHSGSWWDHWLAWIGPRSGELREAPGKLGGNGFAPLEPAPGRYVHERG